MNQQQHNGHSNRSPEEIEREIANTRSEIEDTLSQLQKDLSFSQLADRVMGYVRGSGSDIAHTVGRSVRDNPMPIALIGLGITWFALSQRRGPEEPRRVTRTEYVHEEELPAEGYYQGAYGGDGEISEAQVRARETAARARERAEETMERAGQRMESAKERTRGAMQSAKERTRSAMEKARGAAEKTRGAMQSAKGTVSGAKERASEVSSRARQSARRMGSEVRYQTARASSQLRERVNEQPMLLAVLGIAIGAILGAVLPSTRQEKRMLGPARERFVSRADEAAARSIRETGEAVQRSMEHSASEMEQASREAQQEMQRRAEDEAERRRRESRGPEKGV